MTVAFLNTSYIDIYFVNDILANDAKKIYAACSLSNIRKIIMFINYIFNEENIFTITAEKDYQEMQCIVDFKSIKLFH